MQTILALARTSLTLAFLLYASFSDYKTREVSNSVWILFAPPAFALTFTELFLFEQSQLPFYGLSFGLTAAFAIILFYSGGFGGADAKALMCMALALPFYPYPEKLFTPLSGQNSPISQMFFPMSVFSNSVLFAAAAAVYILLRNVVWRWRTGKELFGKGYESESLGKRILVLITGYKIPIDKLKQKWHLYPLEDVEEETFKQKLVIIPKDEERNAIVERLAKAAEAGKIQKNVWATPGLPMLIFITAGLIAALFFGDVIWVCIRFLLR
ncbi:MAG: prepilin peptidase [Candidatus Bathyarchaeota archaeon]|nr:prepilin peptidase [Candidatus Bathyarchaeota archaeon]